MLNPSMPRPSAFIPRARALISRVQHYVRKSPRQQLPSSAEAVSCNSEKVMGDPILSALEAKIAGLGLTLGQETVYRTIANASGLTAWEAADSLGWDVYDVQNQIGSLRRNGHITYADIRRKRHSDGRLLSVYIATHDAPAVQRHVAAQEDDGEMPLAVKLNILFNQLPWPLREVYFEIYSGAPISGRTAEAISKRLGLGPKRVHASISELVSLGHVVQASRANGSQENAWLVNYSR